MGGRATALPPDLERDPQAAEARPDPGGGPRGAPAKVGRWTPEELLRTLLEEECTARDEARLGMRLYPFVWLPAPMLKCREGGRITNVACVTATGPGADGRREILGLDVLTTLPELGYPLISGGNCLRNDVRGIAGYEARVGEMICDALGIAPLEG